MGSRRKAREIALQLLYMWEFGNTDVEGALKHFWRQGEVGEKVKDFARRIVRGCVEHFETIDALLVESSEHWRLERMAAIDRNIMRLAVFEFLFTPETPKKVVINEAIEIAKRFSTDESTQFINGILDNIRKRVEDGTTDSREIGVQ